MCSLWSPAGKGLTSWLSFVVSYCEFGILGQVWYLIVSIPDICTLTYLDVMRQSACLALNPITVYSYGFLSNCTRVGQASDSMTALT